MLTEDYESNAPETQYNPEMMASLSRASLGTDELKGLQIMKPKVASQVQVRRRNLEDLVKPKQEVSKVEDMEDVEVSSFFNQDFQLGI